NFTHRIRRWMFASSTRSIFVWMIPPLRYSSPFFPKSSLPGFISLIRIVVVLRSRIHSNSWKRSSRGFFESRHDLEDRHRIDDEDVVVQGPLQVHRVHLEISSHVQSAIPSILRRIIPRSTMLTFVSTSRGAEAHLIQVARQVVSALFQRDI